MAVESRPAVSRASNARIHRRLLCRLPLGALCAGPDEGVASALLRTLLPWVNVGRDPGAEASRERDEDAETQHDDGPERRQPG